MKLGWDFSTRWFVANNDTAQNDLSNIKTRQIAPVDLNSFVCMNARLLSEMHGRLGDQIKADSYLKIFLEWKETMEQV